jgi:hypothetical protein
MGLYLPSELITASMYKDFKDQHAEKGEKCPGYQTYRSVLRDKNISFAKLGEEECELCLSYEQHQHSAPKCNTCSEWTQHNERAKEVRHQYQEDGMKDEDNTVYITSDMQKVLLLPRMPGVKACLFTKRLVVFHQTFAPIGRSKHKQPNRKHLVFSVVWHKGIAGRSAAEVAKVYERCIRHYSEVAQKIVIWMDNCAALNKNWTLFSMIATFLNSPTVSVQEVELRYLEKGHTYMAAGSFHAHVEKSLSRKKNVSNFEDFIDAVEAAATPSPKVHEIKFSKFREWGCRPSQRLKDTPILSTIRAVKFCKGSFDMFYRCDSNPSSFVSKSFLKTPSPTLPNGQL